MWVKERLKIRRYDRTTKMSYVNMWETAKVKSGMFILKGRTVWNQ